MNKMLKLLGECYSGPTFKVTKHKVPCELLHADPERIKETLAPLLQDAKGIIVEQVPCDDKYEITVYYEENKK